MDAKRAEERKTARYADLKEELSNQGWDCSLYLIEVGGRGHIIKSVKDCFRSLFRAWLPAGYRSGIGQMIKDVSSTAQPKLNVPGFNEKITLTKHYKSPLPGVVVIFVSLARF
jgi:hypothetical protein